LAGRGRRRDRCCRIGPAGLAGRAGTAGWTGGAARGIDAAGSARPDQRGGWGLAGRARWAYWARRESRTAARAGRERKQRGRIGGADHPWWRRRQEPGSGRWDRQAGGNGAAATGGAAHGIDAADRGLAGRARWACWARRAGTGRSGAGTTLPDERGRSGDPWWRRRLGLNRGVGIVGLAGRRSGTGGVAGSGRADRAWMGALGSSVWAGRGGAAGPVGLLDLGGRIWVGGLGAMGLAGRWGRLVGGAAIGLGLVVGWIGGLCLVVGLGGGLLGLVSWLSGGLWVLTGAGPGQPPMMARTHVLVPLVAGGTPKPVGSHPPDVESRPVRPYRRFRRPSGWL
jgi:hypothetical protein